MACAVRRSLTTLKQLGATCNHRRPTQTNHLHTTTSQPCTFQHLTNHPAFLMSSSSQYTTVTPSEGSDCVVVDLRSDVLTQPSERMKQAMQEASLADDVFDEDSNVHELQDKCAELFGKEAALFVPSGTMGNLISVLCNSDHVRGLEVLLGDKSHLILYEQGGLATLGNVHTRTIPTNKDGTFDLDLLSDYIRPLDDPHQPWTALIGVENTHNSLGGKVLPLGYLKQLRNVVQSTGQDIKIHMDGARLWNAAVAQNKTPAELLADVDTTSVCLSKGAGCPVGSVIAGNKQFIHRALRLRKMLGGGWRKPGMLAAAGIVAVDEVNEKIKQDHIHAQMLARGIMENHCDIVHVDLEGVQSNIVMVDIIKPGLTAAEFCERLAKFNDEEEAKIGERLSVTALPFFPQTLRLVAYSEIKHEDIMRAIAKIQYVIEEYHATVPAIPDLISNNQNIGFIKNQGFLKSSGYRDWESLLYDLSYKDKQLDPAK